MDYVSWMITEAEEKTSSRLVLNGGGVDNVSEDLEVQEKEKERVHEACNGPVFRCSISRVRV